MSKRVLAGLGVLGVMAIAGLVAGCARARSRPPRCPLPTSSVCAFRPIGTTTTRPRRRTTRHLWARQRDPEAAISNRPAVQPLSDFPAARPPAGVVAAPPVAGCRPGVRAQCEIKTQLKSEPKQSPRVVAAPKRRPAAPARTPRSSTTPTRQHQEPAEAVGHAGRILAAGRIRTARHRLESRARRHAQNRFARRPGGRDRPNSTEVQRLKSAAIPLIMSMNEDQKREVRCSRMSWASSRSRRRSKSRHCEACTTKQSRAARSSISAALVSNEPSCPRTRASSTPFRCGGSSAVVRTPVNLDRPLARAMTPHQMDRAAASF